MTIGDICNRELATCERDTALEQVAGLVREQFHAFLTQVNSWVSNAR